MKEEVSLSRYLSKRRNGRETVREKRLLKVTTISTGTRLKPTKGIPYPYGGFGRRVPRVKCGIYDSMDYYWSSEEEEC